MKAKPTKRRRGRSTAAQRAAADQARQMIELRSALAAAECRAAILADALTEALDQIHGGTSTKRRRR